MQRGLGCHQGRKALCLEKPKFSHEFHVFCVGPEASGDPALPPPSLGVAGSGDTADGSLA